LFGQISEATFPHQYKDKDSCWCMSQNNSFRDPN